MSLGFFLLDCDSPCSKEQTDYSAILRSILESNKEILKEVSNHQVEANVDLSSLLDRLNQILGAMNYVAERQDLTTEQIRTSADNLQSKFLQLVKSIEGFESSTLLAVSSLESTFKAESDQSQTLLTQVAQGIADAAKVTEQRYYQYVWAIEAVDVEVVVEIPAGAIEIAAIPYTCFEYTVDGKNYTKSHQYIREAKSIGSHVLVEDSHQIVLPPKAKMHLSYTSLRSIGDPLIKGGVSSPSDDGALAAVLATAETALVDNAVPELIRPNYPPDQASVEG